MKPIDFSKETRLPWQAIIFLIIRGIKKVVIELWAVLLIVYVQSLSDKLSIPAAIGLGVLLILLIAAVRGLLLYKNFSFLVTRDELVVNKGIWSKKTTTIPLHRIQNINISQDFWQQMLDITTLSVDTAGTDDKEMQVYLDLETSNALKRTLTAEKSRFAADDDGCVPPPLSDEHQERWAKATYTYNHRQLIVASLTRNPLRGIWLALILFFSLFSQLEDAWQKQLADTVESWVAGIHSTLYAVVLIAAIAVVVVVIYFVHTFIKYYHLKVTLFKDKIKYERGLIQHVEKFLNLSKIQVIERSRNWFENMAEVSTLRLLQHEAVAENKAEKEVSFVLPGFAAGENLETLIWEGLRDETFVTLVPEKNYLKRNLYISVLYPSLLIGAATIWNGWFAIGLAAWLIIGGASAWLKTRKAKAEVGGRYIRVYGGVWTSKTYTLDIANVQYTSVQQSVFQKRKHTATLVISTRWKNLSVPFIKEESAYALHNFVMYKLQSSEK